MAYRRSIRFGILILAGVAVAACASTPNHPANNFYVNKTESVVQSELGSPDSESPGFFGLPTMAFVNQHPGRIKTEVFNNSGGEDYVEFEWHPDGWVCIESMWVPKGTQF
jgi:hypothetical protein